jgi:Sulfotransferase family
MPATPSQATALANCFVIGAPKAGTTSIDRLLRGHPDVFLSPIKEPSHFCPDVATQLAPSFRKKRQLDVAAYLDSPRDVTGLAWVGPPEHYARLFEGAAGHRVVGECSTFYMSSAAAPELVHRYNPEARIIAALRRPLDRIRSHYEMDRCHGTVTRPLLELVEEELALGHRANWGNCAFYVGASRYREQLRTWHEHFPAQSICILSFERMLADPQAELGRLFDFLDIPAPDTLALPSANRGRAARFSGFNGALHATGLKPRIADLLKRLLPERLERRLKSLYYRPGARVVSDHELGRLEYLLREEGLEEGWEPGGGFRTPTPARGTPAWQT